MQANQIPMRAALGALVLLVLCLLAATAAHAALTLEAHVDRTSVHAGDSLVLTLRLNDTGDYDAPDFSRLQPDFLVEGTSESSSHVIDNGRISASTQWQTTLIPRHAGVLTIPAFTVGGAQSRPITLQVEPPATTADAEAGKEPVFIQASVDNRSVYVQQQLLLTVRVFHAIPLDDMNITQPAFDNASVRKLAQTNFQRTIHGVTYQVHELKYAIFPQQAGELTVPEMVFSADEDNGPSSVFAFPGQGTPVRKMSQQIAVTVKPIPAAFTGKTWLPAHHLTLQETWGGNPDTIAVGDSVTRSIEIRADGLMASQLPQLDTPDLPDAKLYADKPTLKDQPDANGLHGERVQSAALIPTRPGPLTLPAIRVVWWDLDTDSQKVATLPAETLTIKPGAAATTPPPQTTPVASQKGAAAITATPGGTTALQVPAIVGRARFWMGIAAGFALLWLATLTLWWRQHRRLSSISKPPVATPGRTANVDGGLLHVIAACADNDAGKAYAALGNWLRRARPATPTPTQWLNELDRDPEAVRLTQAVRTLERSAFGDDGGAWNGKPLAAELERWRKQHKPARTVSPDLPPLYPT